MTFSSVGNSMRVRIPIITQYKNIYVIIEQFMTLAELIVGASGI